MLEITAVVTLAVWGACVLRGNAQRRQAGASAARLIGVSLVLSLLVVAPLLLTLLCGTHDWVFAGSGFWKDPDTGKSYYRAEGGEVICVSNFPTAMLDILVESSQSNDALSFEAFTENIPPRYTPVRVYLVPRLAEQKDSPEEKKLSRRQAGS